jgi:uncharacterized protein (TIGR00290 family)
MTLKRMLKMKANAIFCWSGGKDSAFCLHKVLTEGIYEIKYLLTTINANVKRISLHGVRETLLDQQIASIGIPALKVYVAEGTNDEYEKEMERILLKAKAEGIEHVIFGDIFLADLRAYREKNLAKVGMTAVFPLWQMDTTILINSFIAQKFKTIICCINDAYLTEEWVGKEIDVDFIKNLPKGVDPCGENGEYHTFCYDGPIFKRKIELTFGAKVYKPLVVNKDFISESKTKGFWYIDLIPL